MTDRDAARQAMAHVAATLSLTVRTNETAHAARLRRRGVSEALYWRGRDDARAFDAHGHLRDTLQLRYFGGSVARQARVVAVLREALADTALCVHWTGEADGLLALCRRHAAPPTQR